MGSQIGEFNDGNFLINLAINFHTVVVFVAYFKTSFKVVVATLCIPTNYVNLFEFLKSNTISNQALSQTKSPGLMFE